MIYPKCLYKTREITKVAKDEDEHKVLAKQGWKDIWTDKEPHAFKEREIIVEFIEPVKKKRTRKKGKTTNDIKPEIKKPEIGVSESL